VREEEEEEEEEEEDLPDPTQSLKPLFPEADRNMK